MENGAQKNRQITLTNIEEPQVHLNGGPALPRPPSPGNELMQVGSCCLDRANFQLFSATGELVHLRHQSMRVLIALANASPKLIEHETLLDKLWAERCVTPDSLVQCIADIRRAIGDRKKRVLITVSKQGYRLLATAIHATPAIVPTLAPMIPNTLAVPADASVSSLLDTRKPLMSVLLQAVQAAHAGQGGQMLVLRGPRGSGKRFLLEKLHEHAAALSMPMVQTSVPALEQPGLCCINALLRLLKQNTDWPCQSEQPAGDQLAPFSVQEDAKADLKGRLDDIRQCLAQLCVMARPLVLAITNLQRCDAATIDVLNAAIPALVKANVLVVATLLDTPARFLSVPLRQMLNAGVSDKVLKVHETPVIGKEDVAQLAEWLAVKAPSDAAIEALLHYTGGNLNYVRRYLPRSGKLRLAPELIPQDVLNMIDQRLGMLDSLEESLVALLSVNGRGISIDRITALLGCRESDLEPAIHRLAVNDAIGFFGSNLFMKIPLEADGVIRCLTWPALQRMKSLLHQEALLVDQHKYLT